MLLNPSSRAVGKWKNGKWKVLLLGHSRSRCWETRSTQNTWKCFWWTCSPMQWSQLSVISVYTLILCQDDVALRQILGTRRLYWFYLQHQTARLGRSFCDLLSRQNEIKKNIKSAGEQRHNMKGISEIMCMIKLNTNMRFFFGIANGSFHFWIKIFRTHFDRSLLENLSKENQRYARPTDT